MKKTLVALAAFAATGSAFAMGHAAPAPASSVTLYGRLDASVVSVQRANAASQSLTALGDSNIASSIWGLRGVESLGGGMRALFNVEGDVSVANGNVSAAGVFRRAANVGVAGNFGEVTLGLRMNPLISAWVGGQVLPSNSVFAATALAANFASPDFFTKNAITYIAPKLGVATVAVQHGFSNNAAGSTAGSMTSFSVTAPLPGGIELRGAYQERKPNGIANVSSNDVNGKKTTYLGAKATFGAATVGLNWVNNEVKTPAGVFTHNVDLTQVTASYSLSRQLTVGGSYTNLDSKIAGHGDTKLMNLQARYALSPRTVTYVQMGQADNPTTGVAVTPVWTTVAAVAGKRQTSMGLGVIHNF